MEVIEIAKKLGEALVKSEEYKAYETAKAACHDKDELRVKIDHYKVQRQILDTESAKEDKDQMLTDALAARVATLYKELNDDPLMVAYTDAEDTFNLLIQAVNMTIASYLGSENEEEEDGHSCSSGGCSGCHGCH